MQRTIYFRKNLNSKTPGPDSIDGNDERLERFGFCRDTLLYNYLLRPKKHLFTWVILQNWWFLGWHCCLVLMKVLRYTKLSTTTRMWQNNWSIRLLRKVFPPEGNCPSGPDIAIASRGKLPQTNCDVMQGKLWILGGISVCSSDFTSLRLLSHGTNC